MRAVVQRVTSARVTVADRPVGGIRRGLLVLVGIARGDGGEAVSWLVDKIVGLRVFPDDDGRMNRSVLEVDGGVLLVSQFTLYGDCRRGRRPSFDGAAAPAEARALYEGLVDGFRGRGVAVETGTFQAHMRVHSINDGPVTILLDTDKAF
jgi:D-tyrosyl-tRNA(Tyr) deacylase